MSGNDALQTPLLKMLGCRYPIVQTAMGWVARPELVAASCNAGAFGFLAAASLTADEVGPSIDRVRSMTDQPFGVNFHMFQPGASRIVDTIIAARVRAVSFGRGPDKNIIRRFRDAGIVCMPTVGALRHAQKMVEIGVDAITIQGGEGGGHTGSVPTTLLLPQVLDAVRVPVVAAGGFFDGRGLAAALAYGAAGVAMGTRFLMTRDCPVPEVTKTRYVRRRSRRYRPDDQLGWSAASLTAERNPQRGGKRGIGSVAGSCIEERVAAEAAHGGKCRRAHIRCSRHATREWLDVWSGVDGSELSRTDRAFNDSRSTGRGRDVHWSGGRNSVRFTNLRRTDRSYGYGSTTAFECAVWRLS